MIFTRRQRVFVELRDGVPIRILNHAPYDPDGPPVVEWSRAGAVSAIRAQVFDRAAGHCERCDTPITPSTGHMHEVLPRGRGGEISLANSVALCARCHLGKTGVHANHYPQFGLRKE